MTELLFLTYCFYNDMSFRKYVSFNIIPTLVRNINISSVLPINNILVFKHLASFDQALNYLLTYVLFERLCV